MGQIIVGVFLIFNHLYKLALAFGTGSDDGLFQGFSHFLKIIGYLFKELIKYPILREKEMNPAIHAHG